MLWGGNSTTLLPVRRENKETRQPPRSNDTGYHSTAEPRHCRAAAGFHLDSEKAANATMSVPEYKLDTQHVAHKYGRK